MSLSGPPQPGTSLHPKLYGQQTEQGMKFPGDMRRFREVKLAEIPSWIAKRDFSPLGIFFSLKRFKHAYWSKYSGRRPGFAPYVQLASVMFIVSYISNYSWLRKNEQTKKYH